MARRHSTQLAPRRSRREWIFRGIAGLILATTGLAQVSESFAVVAVRADPERAHILAPRNGAIAAAYAANLFTVRPEAADTSKPAILARTALRQEPTAVAAFTVLGFKAQLRGERQQSNRLFDYSNRLSRRQLRAQMWAIEDAVSRGDIGAALRHYDIALRTSDEAWSFLFPALTSALREPRVRAGLLPVLTSKPTWSEPFVTYLSTNRVEPEGAMRLFAEGRAAGLEISPDSQARMVNALFAAGKMLPAWTYYLSLRPGADRSRSRDRDFAARIGTPTVFDWVVDEKSASFVAMLSEDGGGVLDFSVPPGVGGSLVRQMQFLPPGRYRLRGHSRSIRQPEQSRPYWAFSCHDGRVLNHLLVPDSDRQGGRFSAEITVPEGCLPQSLSFEVRPSDDPSGVTGQFDHILLEPAE